ncbi:Tuberous sclerosis 2 protein [Ceratobasidium theobromae]|uniref:Tuberous sclerosis 2 protein n=1 Tax=Ceratobasidium theobromae TaxID=1582974 RepID=A0A5N5Q9W3_9AGAM|nr:Tuberous sclerosis 2 protein [Ceratobasidium theobromae]
MTLYDDSAPNPTPQMNPTILAVQLAQHLCHPTSLSTHPHTVVGAGPIGLSVLADVIRCLRKQRVKGGEIIGARIESLTTLEEARRLGLFDLGEWAERDKSVRVLMDRGQDVLRLTRLSEIIGVARHGKWRANGARSGRSCTYIEAQKCINAILWLLEDGLRCNALRFDEAQVGDGSIGIVGKHYAETLQAIGKYPALLLAYVQTPMDVLGLGGCRRSVAGRRGLAGGRRGNEGTEKPTL